MIIEIKENETRKQTKNQTNITASNALNMHYLWPEDNNNKQIIKM